MTSTPTAEPVRANAGVPFDKVRFLGYAVPTTPADMVAVGDPNGSGAVAGTYRAADDFDSDIGLRLTVLKNAVDAAVAALEEPAAPGVLNVFMAPEFFWHGTMGPYIHTSDDDDPVDRILPLLRETFPAEEYPTFLFVFGTAITAKVADIDAVLELSTVTVRNEIVKALGEGWRHADGPLKDVIFDAFANLVKLGHSYPEVEVRNRALVLAGSDLDSVGGASLGGTTLTTEKYFDSNEDFLLWDVTGKPVITEQITAYPVLDISRGDFKADPRDPFAIFELPGQRPVRVGVEICLDHSDTRLRKGSFFSPWQDKHDAVGLHLIPSCGMQVHPASVAAGAGGWVFNCDGQYALTGVDNPGTPHHDVQGDVPSMRVDYVDAAGADYAAHTQLAHVARCSQGADEFRVNARNAVLDEVAQWDADVDVSVVPVTAVPGHDEVFAGGPGAVHIFGRAVPLPLPDTSRSRE